MSVDVQTPVFEGPFDLLLHLILREQVDLYEVSLISIVDAYLAELARLDGFDLELATDFLLIAATLVELKARRLLPGLDDGELDDELSLWEERDLLLARLLEAKTFKDAALVLLGMHESAGRCYARRVGPDERFVDLTPDALEGVTPLRLREAFVSAMEPRPEPRIDLFHVAPIRASVVDAVTELLDELPTGGPNHLSGSDRGVGGEDRDRRAVPGGSGAVQTGHHRCRSGPPASVTSRSSGGVRRVTMTPWTWWTCTKGDDERRCRETETEIPRPRRRNPIETEIRRAIEAIVMVAESPADPRLLAQLIEVSPERIDAVCEALEAEYAQAADAVSSSSGWPVAGDIRAATNSLPTWSASS